MRRCENGHLVLGRNICWICFFTGKPQRTRDSIGEESSRMEGWEELEKVLFPKREWQVIAAAILRGDPDRMIVVERKDLEAANPDFVWISEGHGIDGMVLRYIEGDDGSF